MKTKILFIAFISSFQLFAQPAKNIDTTKFAEITFEEPDHDFGTLKKGDNCEYNFVFTNTGNDVLIITNIIENCGCAVSRWPKEPILPNQSGVINYKYDSQRIGNFQKNFYVYTNSKVSTTIVKVKGLVLPNDTLLDTNGALKED